MYHHQDPEPLNLDTVRGYVEHYQSASLWLWTPTADLAALVARRPRAVVDERQLPHGDAQVLGIAVDCGACDRLAQHLVPEVESLPGLQLDVYVGGARDEDIEAWAARLRLPQAVVQQGRLTLNHDGTRSAIQPY